MTYTIIRIPLLYENLASTFRPHRLEDGVFALTLPLEGVQWIGWQPVIWAGRCLTMMLKPWEWGRQVLNLGGEWHTVQQIAHILEKHYPLLAFQCPKITVADFEGFNFKGSKDLAGLFYFLQRKDVERNSRLTRRLAGSITTLDRWLTLHKADVHKAIEEAYDCD